MSVILYLQLFLKTVSDIVSRIASYSVVNIAILYLNSAAIKKYPNSESLISISATILIVILFACFIFDIVLNQFPSQEEINKHLTIKKWYLIIPIFSVVIAISIFLTLTYLFAFLGPLRSVQP